jgi:cytochrome oxidase assembly protein ShyY1
VDYPVTPNTPARLQAGLHGWSPRPRPWRWLTLVAGAWQLSRAHQKEALQAGIDAQQGTPALDNAAGWRTMRPAADLHRPVRLRAAGWPAQRLSGQPPDERPPGFYVLTPLRLKAATSVVLVQRGWVPAQFCGPERLAAGRDTCRAWW